jgi:CheY-like chemotaxis protein
VSEIKWDIKRGYQAYKAVSGSRLKKWISDGRIKKGEVTVWRSGFSGFRRPEELRELAPYFGEYQRRISARAKKTKNDGFQRRRPKRTIKNILIVDDEQDLGSFLTKFLQPLHYEVTVATSGKEALQQLKKDKVDLIFLDENLPDTSGVKLLPRMRQINPKPAIVMISGYGSEELKKRTEELGVQFFLDKPFNFKTILKVIQGCQERDTKVRRQ